MHSRWIVVLLALALATPTWAAPPPPASPTRRVRQPIFQRLRQRIATMPRVSMPRIRLPEGLRRLSPTRLFRSVRERVKHPSPMAVWGVSTATLGAAETTYIASTTTPLLAGIQRLGFLGGAGLTYSAVKDIRRAKTMAQKMDAAGDLAWGVEGMLEFSPVFSGAAGKLAPIVGTIGGLCQTGVGLRRMWQGARTKDWGKFKLGVLDAASGGLWLAWDLFGVENPVVIGGFVGLMIGREVYANREQIKDWGKRTGQKIGDRFQRTTHRAQARVRLAGRQMRHFKDNMLQRMGRGLERPAPGSSSGGPDPLGGLHH